MSLAEVSELFSSIGDDQRATKVTELLQPLLDLGLGYLRLGHPLNSVYEPGMFQPDVRLRFL